MVVGCDNGNQASDLNLVGLDINANLSHQGCLDFGSGEECTCPEEKGSAGLCYPSIEDERADRTVRSEIVYGTSAILRIYIELDKGEVGQSFDLSELEVRLIGTRLDTWRPEDRWAPETIYPNAVEFNGLDAIDNTMTVEFPVVDDGNLRNWVEMDDTTIYVGYSLLDENDEDDRGAPSDFNDWLNIDDIYDDWWYDSSNLPALGIGDDFSRIRATLKEHNSTIDPRNFSINYRGAPPGIYYLVVHAIIDTEALTPGRWRFDVEVDPNNDHDESDEDNNLFLMDGEVDIIVPDTEIEPVLPSLAITGEVVDNVCSVVSDSPMTFWFDTLRPRFDSRCGNDHCGCGFCDHPQYNYFDDDKVEKFRRRNMWFHEILGPYGTGMYLTTTPFGYDVGESWVPLHCPSKHYRSEDCHSLVPETPKCDEIENIVMFFAGNSGDGSTQSITGQSHDTGGCQKHLDNDEITMVPGIWDNGNGVEVPDPALGDALKRLYVKKHLEPDDYESVFEDDDDSSIWNDCEPAAKEASITAVLLNQIATMSYMRDPGDPTDGGLTARNTFFFNATDHGNKVVGPFLETGGESVAGLLDGYLALLKDRTDNLNNVKRVWFAGSSKGGIMALLLMKWLKDDIFSKYETEYESHGLTKDELEKMTFVVTMIDPVASAGDNQWLNGQPDPNKSVRLMTRDTDNWVHPGDYDHIFPKNEPPGGSSSLRKSHNVYIMSFVSDGSGAMNTIVHPTSGDFNDIHCDDTDDEVSHDDYLDGDQSKVYLRQQGLRKVRGTSDNQYEYGCGNGSHAHLSRRWKDIKDLEMLRFFFDATGLNCPEPRDRVVNNGVYFKDGIRKFDDFCMWPYTFTPEQTITCGGEE